MNEERFFGVLKAELAKNKISFDEFYDPQNVVARRILEEYGAVFVARGGAVPPPKIIFDSEQEVIAFQARLSTAKEKIGGFEIELQTAAMNDLKKAITEARRAGLSITPRGADSARRSYAQTVRLWASRVNPALEHWTRKRKLTIKRADQLRALRPFEQVAEVFTLEEKGIFFSKDLSKSIVYSVAPPGTSQHLSLLALDVAEFSDGAVRAVLRRHGWFRTVVSDLPHFTYLGAKESELTDLGLKKIINHGQSFWVPDI